jgi:hypothetical protein
MARIYWQPMGIGPLRKLDIDFVTALEVRKDVQYGESETLGGSLARSIHGQWERITIEREVIPPATTDGALALRELRTLESHLLAGFHIGLAIEPAYAYLTWLPLGVAQGSTAVNTTAGNAYAVWEPSVTAPTVGQEYVLHELSALRKEERHRVTAVGGISATLDEDVAYGIPTTATSLFRHRYFWPALRLHADSVERGSILVDEGGARSFTLLMELREDLVQLLTDKQQGAAQSQGPNYQLGRVAGGGDNNL